MLTPSVSIKICYMLLAQALFMMLRPTVSHRSKNVAFDMLIEFDRKFRYLYQKFMQTLNFHQLMHLCDDISSLKQLYMYSCFVYEGKNCHLMKFISGTEHVDKQSISAIALIQKIPQLLFQCYKRMVPDDCKSLVETIKL